jgi:aspartate oxidase
MDSLFPPAAWDGVEDVVIAGGGLSGLACALRFAPRPVTVVTAAGIGDGAARDENGAGLPASGRARPGLAEEAPACVQELTKRGVKVDATDWSSLTDSLCEAVRRTSSIRVVEHHVVEQLRMEDGFVTGLVARDRRGGLSDRMLMPARAVVLATGGVGRLCSESSDAELRGDGLAMAARAGALIADADIMRRSPGRPDGDRRIVGGVHVDAAGRTTVDGLWACGDVALSRERSETARQANPLLEALAIACRAAEDILRQLPRPSASRLALPRDEGSPLTTEEEDAAILSQIRSLMIRHLGASRDRAGLLTALARLDRIAADARAPRARNAAIAAKLIAASALARRDREGGEDRVFMTLAAADTMARSAAAASEREIA